MNSSMGGHAGPKSPAVSGLFTKAFVEDFAAIGRAMEGIEVCHARSVLLALHQLTNSNARRRAMTHESGVLVASLMEIGRWAGLSVRKTGDVLRDLVAIGRVGTVRSVGATGRFYLRGLMSEDQWRAVAVNCLQPRATPAPGADPTPAHCADVKEMGSGRKISCAERPVDKADREGGLAAIRVPSPMESGRTLRPIHDRTGQPGRSRAANPDDHQVQEAERAFFGVRDTAKIERMLGIDPTEEVACEFRAHDTEWRRALAYAFAWRAMDANRVRRDRAAAIAVTRMRQILKGSQFPPVPRGAKRWGTGGMLVPVDPQGDQRATTQAKCAPVGAISPQVLAIPCQST